MSLNQILKENNWAVHQSPPDSHCLLHSTVTSHASQLPNAPMISLVSLKDNIVSHVLSCIDDYTIYGLTVPAIKFQLKDSIHEILQLHIL